MAPQDRAGFVPPFGGGAETMIILDEGSEQKMGKTEFENGSGANRFWALFDWGQGALSHPNRGILL